MTIDMSKRAFIRKAGKKISEVVVQQADKKLKPTVNWFRPPYALAELEFIIACTACGQCVDACEPGVLFSLKEECGISVSGTPVMNLALTPCQLCGDWPCVQACPSGALDYSLGRSLDQTPDSIALSDKEVPPMPKLSTITIDEKSCLPFFGPECGVCVSICPVPGAISLNDIKPVVNDELCVGCAQCRNSCVTDPSSIHMQLVDSQRWP